MARGYKLNERDAQVIEYGYKKYGYLSIPFLMVKLKCDFKKAKWITDNIRTQKDLKRFKYENKICSP